jgi:hypothetical protein
MLVPACAGAATDAETASATNTVVALITNPRLLITDIYFLSR